MTLTGLLLGGACGAACAAVVALRRADERGQPLAAFLSVAAGIYIGYGLQDGRPGQIATQILGALPFVVVAATWPRAVGILGFAWLAHGLWDGAHELGLVATMVPSWYPAACFGLDMVLGTAALVWAYLPRTRSSSGAPSRS